MRDSIVYIVLLPITTTPVPLPIFFLASGGFSRCAGQLFGEHRSRSRQQQHALLPVSFLVEHVGCGGQSCPIGQREREEGSGCRKSQDMI